MSLSRGPIFSFGPFLSSTGQYWLGKLIGIG
jgi:hypothetical protein